MTIERNPDDIFKEFVQANSWPEVITLFEELCRALNITRYDRRPGNQRELYSKIKNGVRYIQAQNLWSLLDKRAAMPEYMDGTPCQGKKVLVIGAGPCGLRMALESSLLGAHTVVVEMRNYITRNNVLHLWPFVIQDLKFLGAKVFYPRFCVGSVNHISIRTLQLILLKICLVFGVEVHAPVKYNGLCEPCPDTGRGWHINLDPADCPASAYDYDVIVGADGKRNSLIGYTRKCLKPKLAIAITINLVNGNTQVEQQVDEIPGLAYIFNTQFFNNLKEKAGIDLENIVYYRDETHYFVMTPKKSCLLAKGVLKQDYSNDTQKLLSRENIDHQKLLEFGRDAAYISTAYKLPPDLEFAKNHYNEEDVAIFDFTTMSSAKHSCLARERRGQKLLTCLVGDTLLEPFWPTGSGCARGFLGVFDAAWLMRGWCQETDTPTQLLANRESIYGYIKQTKPDTLCKKIKNYTIDPYTRYGTRVKYDAISAEQAAGLYVMDPVTCDLTTTPVSPPKWIPASPPASNKRKRSNIDDTNSLLSWFKRKLKDYHGFVEVNDLNSSWRDGVAFAALLQEYRPDLIDVKKLKKDNVLENLKLVFNLFEKEFGVSQLLNAQHMAKKASPDPLAMLSYLVSIKDELEKEPVRKARKNDHKEKTSVHQSLFDVRQMGDDKRAGTSMTLNIRRKPKSPTYIPASAKSRSLDRNMPHSMSTSDYISAMKRAVLAKKYGRASVKKLRNSKRVSGKKLASPPPHQTIHEQPNMSEETGRITNGAGMENNATTGRREESGDGHPVMFDPDHPSVRHDIPDEDEMSDEETSLDDNEWKWRSKSIKACHGRAKSKIKMFENIQKPDANAESPPRSPYAKQKRTKVTENKDEGQKGSSHPKRNNTAELMETGENQVSECKQPMTLFDYGHEQRATLFEYGQGQSDITKPKHSKHSPVKSRVTFGSDDCMIDSDQPEELLLEDERMEEDKVIQGQSGRGHEGDMYMSISRQACRGKVQDRLHMFGGTTKPVSSPAPRKPDRLPVIESESNGDEEKVHFQKKPLNIKTGKRPTRIGGKFPRASMKACHNVVKKRLNDLGKLDDVPERILEDTVSDAEESDGDFRTPEEVPSDEDNSRLSVNELTKRLEARSQPSPILRQRDKDKEKENKRLSYSGSEDLCCVCGQQLYVIEKRSSMGLFFHRNCYRCDVCKVYLAGGAVCKNENETRVKFYCRDHGRDSLNSIDLPSPISEAGSTLDTGSMLTLQDFDLTPEEVAEYFMGDDGTSTSNTDDSGDSEEDEYFSMPEDEVDDTDAGNLRHQTFTSLQILEEHELQRGLVEIAEEGEELEKEGLKVENKFRGTKGSASSEGDKDKQLMENWLDVVQRKQDLLSRERKLMLQAYTVEKRAIQHKMEKLLSQPLFSDEAGKVEEKDAGQLDAEMASIAERMNEVLQQIAKLRVTISQSSAQN